MFLRGIVQNFIAVFKGKNLLWHVLAIVLTAVLVFSGADWAFFEHTRSGIFRFLIWSAGIGGFFVPFIVPIALYFWGEFRRDRRLMDMGAAVGQAAVIAYVVSSIYKAFTGRMQPEFLTNYSSVDITRDFHFGFWQNGIFWGWPSSHTAVAFAAAFVFVFLARNVAMRVIAIVYAVFIAIGAGIGFHWLSDVVAGALFGILIAMIVTQRASPLVTRRL